MPSKGFSPAALLRVLDTHTPAAATGLVVALSGGADSACLLTALSRLPRFRDLPLRAVHVDHALQPAAADFQRACEKLCRSVDIPLAVIAVQVDSGPGVSIEAAARDARYAALAAELRPGECLLTAHHADDQAETLLLQLLRGAGLKGMAAMALCRAWHRGWHLRPLLEFTKRELRHFSSSAGISAVTDPMNDDARFDRVYLRAHLWPIIEARWPGAAIAVSRTAGHVAEAQALLDRSAAGSIDRLRDGDALTVPGLRALSPPEQINALRHWIAMHGAPPPPAARLIEALRQILAAEPDHQPAVMWGAYALRRYRNRLFLTPASSPALNGRCDWAVAEVPQIDLGGELGILEWSPLQGGLDPARLPACLTVRGRRGGETLKLQRRGKTHTLQHLCQELGILPWMRDALPLVYAGRDLVAVGDLWQDARWCVAARAPGFGCTWRGAPILI